MRHSEDRSVGRTRPYVSDKWFHRPRHRKNKNSISVNEIMVELHKEPWSPFSAAGKVAWQRLALEGWVNVGAFTEDGI